MRVLYLVLLFSAYVGLNLRLTIGWEQLRLSRRSAVEYPKLYFTMTCCSILSI
jgi:hypothetical protein